MNEYVVLVDEHNQPIGQAEKLATHTARTPLHRGFSVFLFNQSGELLLQQRSKTKKTWPLVWSNSCCGHPVLGESPEDAAKRRLQDELGMTRASIRVLLPEYRYRFERQGIVENEFCPVMVAVSDQEPVPNPDEVGQIQWVQWTSWIKEIQENPYKYSEWCMEETMLLEADAGFHKFYQKLIG